MMTSLTERESQALDAIGHGLAGSDPRLASMLNIFGRLAAGEEMPERENIRGRRLYPRLGLQQAMLLWVVITAGILAVALVLSTSGHKGCIQSMGTACPSPR